MHHNLILNAICRGVRRWELLENTRYFGSSGHFCILHSCESLFTEDPVKQNFQKQSIPFFNSHHLYAVLEVRKLEAYWIERTLSSFLFISLLLVLITSLLNQKLCSWPMFPNFKDFFTRTHSKNWASLVAQLVKNPLTVQETWVQFLGREDPLEKG